MKQENLRILKVYTQNGKQVAFAVTNGRVIHQVDKETIEESIKNGDSYVNASVSSSGIFRVDSNVQREPFKKTKLEIIGFLYHPSLPVEGVICKVNNDMTLAGTCADVRRAAGEFNKECSSKDMNALNSFQKNRVFKEGYKYIDVSKKNFKKLDIYKIATPSLMKSLDEAELNSLGIKGELVTISSLVDIYSVGVFLMQFKYSDGSVFYGIRDANTLKDASNKGVNLKGVEYENNTVHISPFCISMSLDEFWDKFVPTIDGGFSIDNPNIFKAYVAYNNENT